MRLSRRGDGPKVQPPRAAQDAKADQYASGQTGSSVTSDKPVPFNPRSNTFGDNKEACETLGWLQEHLRKENAFKLDGMEYRLGHRLIVDAPKEKIIGDDQVSAMLTRDYRKPFFVPGKEM